MRGVVPLLKQLDLFALPVTINYKGNQKFPTIFGSVVSVLCFTLITVFTMLKVQGLLNRDNANISTNTIMVDLQEEFGVLNAKENRFDFAIGLINLKTWQYASVDPRFMSLTARRVDMTLGSNVTFSKTVLPIVPCKPNDHFTKVPQINWENAMLELYQCI